MGRESSHATAADARLSHYFVSQRRGQWRSRCLLFPDSLVQAKEASLPGEARAGGEAGGLAVEQLPSLCGRERGVVETESQGTAGKRERAGVFLTLKVRTEDPRRSEAWPGRPRK